MEPVSRWRSEAAAVASTEADSGKDSAFVKEPSTTFKAEVTAAFSCSSVREWASSVAAGASTFDSTRIADFEE